MPIGDPLFIHTCPLESDNGNTEKAGCNGLLFLCLLLRKASLISYVMEIVMKENKYDDA